MCVALVSSLPLFALLKTNWPISLQILAFSSRNTGLITTMKNFGLPNTWYVPAQVNSSFYYWVSENYLPLIDTWAELVTSSDVLVIIWTWKGRDKQGSDARLLGRHVAGMGHEWGLPLVPLGQAKSIGDLQRALLPSGCASTDTPVISPLQFALLPFLLLNCERKDLVCRCGWIFQ
jgi:hypothetical protein